MFNGHIYVSITSVFSYMLIIRISPRPFFFVVDVLFLQKWRLSG